MKNAAAKSFKQINKLIKQDGVLICWTKDNKTIIQQRFSGYIKAGKKNKNRHTSCLAKVTKYWGVQHRDKFARLYYYLCCSKTHKTMTDLSVSTISVPAKPSTRRVLRC